MSAKPAQHFTSSPNGSLYGMVVKAKAGEFTLVRTVSGLRTGAQAVPKGALQQTLYRLPCGHVLLYDGHLQLILRSYGLKAFRCVALEVRRLFGNLRYSCLFSYLINFQENSEYPERSSRIRWNR